MKNLLTILFAMLILSGCETALKTQTDVYGKTAAAVATFDDNNARAAVLTPCLITGGTLFGSSVFNDIEVGQIVQHDKMFCHKARELKPGGALSPLPVPPIPTP